MKRMLATDGAQSTETNKKFASNARVKLENSKASTAAAAGTTKKATKRSGSIVLLSSDDEEIIAVSKSRPKRKSTSLNENFIVLKKAFPNVTEGLLLERLNQTKNNKNCLQDAMTYFASIQTDEPTNDVLVIENEAAYEPLPTTSAGVATNTVIKTENSKTAGADAAAARQLSPEIALEIAFIQSLFPNINDQLAAEILRNVDNNNTNDKNMNAEARESQIVDYIIDNELNEIADNGTPVEDHNLDKDLNSVQSVIEDCDPTYILDKLKAMSNNPRRVELVVAELVEKKSYPKMKEYLNQIRKQKEIDAHLNTPINIEEFLKIYPEPFSRFYQNTKEMSESYKAHCRTELLNRFDFISEETILEILNKHKYHLTPAYRQLETAVLFKETELKQRAQSTLKNLLTRRNFTLETATKQLIQAMPKTKFTKNRVSYKIDNIMREKQQYPDILDTNFFKEMQFIKNESQIKAYIIEKDQKRKQKFEDAKRNKNLLECTCCYDNELLDEDMLMCPEGHIFCKECVKRFAETTIGDCKFVFNCIDENCKVEFEMSTLSEVLEPNTLSKVLRNIQNEEIKKAGLDNLETCQHCTYAAIIENPLDKVFRCLNPECLKETCRLCKEPNHLPLRCNEIEKSDEVNMRTWIENKVTEAMIRQCHACSKRFFKVEGCNMMHCVCGAAMCYICRAAVPSNIGYKHFTENGCKQFTDVAELHQIEMEKAYKEANELYLKEHPESAHITLKHDPKKILEELNKEKEKQKKKQEQQRQQQLQQQQRILQTQLQQHNRENIRQMQQQLQQRLQNGLQNGLDLQQQINNAMQEANDAIRQAHTVLRGVFPQPR